MTAAPPTPRGAPGPLSVDASAGGRLMGVEHAHGHASAAGRRCPWHRLAADGGVLPHRLVLRHRAGLRPALARWPFSDAGHMAADVVALGAARLATRIATGRAAPVAVPTAPTRRGIFASGFTVLLMLGMSVYVVLEALSRIGRTSRSTRARCSASAPSASGSTSLHSYCCAAAPASPQRQGGLPRSRRRHRRLRRRDHRRLADRRHRQPGLGHRRRARHRHLRRRLRRHPGRQVLAVLGQQVPAEMDVDKVASDLNARCTA